MNKIKKQYVLTVYEDASVRVTERNITPRGYHGYFVGKPHVVGTTVCPVCGATLSLMKEVA